MGKHRPMLLSMVLKGAITLQGQGFIDDTVFLDPFFHSCCRPVFRMETTLVSLVDDLRGSASLLILHDPSVAFDTINHSILLKCLLAGLGVGEPV